MRERALRFGRGGTLIGVLAEPPGDAPRNGVGVVLLNSGLLHRVGAGRWHVELARSLASRGYPVLRFDFSGIGDSDPRRDGMAFEAAALEETREAMDLLHARGGADAFILVGLCSGADMGYYTALAEPRVVGLVQLDPFVYRTPRYYLQRYGPKLLSWPSWRNVLTGRTYIGPAIRRLLRQPGANGSGPAEADRVISPYVRAFPPKGEIEAGLDRLAARGVRMYCLFSGGQLDHYNYQGQYHRAFRRVKWNGLLDEVYLPDADHVFSGLPHRRFVLEAVARWLVCHWPNEEPAFTPELSLASPGPD